MRQPQTSCKEREHRCDEEETKKENNPNKFDLFSFLVSQFERKTNSFYALFYYKIKGRTLSPTLNGLILSFIIPDLHKLHFYFPKFTINLL